jgi:hypothetical protein
MSVALDLGDDVVLLARDTSCTERLILAGVADGVTNDRGTSEATLAALPTPARERRSVYLPTHDRDGSTRLAAQQSTLRKPTPPTRRPRAAEAGSGSTSPRTGRRPLGPGGGRMISRIARWARWTRRPANAPGRRTDARERRGPLPKSGAAGAGRGGGWDTRRP